MSTKKGYSGYLFGGPRNFLGVYIGVSLLGRTGYALGNGKGNGTFDVI